MILSLIYARSENRVIGRDGGLPWRLPDEFGHFKRTTMGHPLIMGRRTFEDHNTALPGRTNIVLTTRDDLRVDGIVVKRTLAEALEPYRGTDEEVFVGGGAGVFAEAFPLADRVYETIVHANVEGDTLVPEFDFTGWNRQVLGEHAPDARHAHAFTIYRWDRV